MVATRTRRSPRCSTTAAKRPAQAWYFGELLDVFERRLPDSRNLPEFRRLVGEVFAG